MLKYSVYQKETKDKGDLVCVSQYQHNGLCQRAFKNKRQSKLKWMKDIYTNLQ